MNAPSNDVNDTRGFLEGEVVRLQKQNKRTLIGGAIILLAVGGYMTFITNFVCRYVLDPAGAAQWVAYMAEQNLPVALSSAERTLTAQAPALADQVMSGMTTIPAYIGNEARRHIDVVADEVLPHLAAELTESVNTHFDDSRGDAQAFYAAHSEPEFVQTFVDTLVADAGRALDDRLSEDIGGGGLQHLSIMTLDSLQVINEQLEHLNNTPVESLTRRDHIQKQLILNCLHVLDGRLAEASARGPLFDVQGTL